jgi:MFS family permease
MLKRVPFHYGWIILPVAFLALMTAAGVRSLPGIVLVPLENEFGWTRTAISTAIMVSLFIFGFGGPLGGWLIDRFGPRRVMLGGLVMIALGLFPLLLLGEMWQLYVFWGVLVGLGTGALAGPIGGTVALRWFNKYRGMVVGLFGAASAAGQLVFVPLLIDLNAAQGWRYVVLALGVAVAVAFIPVLFFMRNRPQDMDQEAYGEATAATAQVDNRKTPLREVIRTRDFWLLSMSFFVCGYTTNGLIQTHLLPHTLEHGFVEGDIKWALGIMGALNIIGTLTSGWLCERFDNRKLLACYYGFRALSLAALPFILDMQGMLLFAVVYGLDWVATVPPTVNLTAQRFGRGSLGTVYGWIFCSHMIGAGIASMAGGFFRDLLGDYHLIFISAAVMGIIASGLSLGISNLRKPKVSPKPA